MSSKCFVLELAWKVVRGRVVGGGPSADYALVNRFVPILKYLHRIANGFHFVFVGIAIEIAVEPENIFSCSSNEEGDNSSLGHTHATR